VAGIKNIVIANKVKGDMNVRKAHNIWIAQWEAAQRSHGGPRLPCRREVDERRFTSGEIGAQLVQIEQTERNIDVLEDEDNLLRDGSAAAAECVQ
jgi:hypothetical protein